MSEAAAGGNIQYIVYNMDDKEVFLNAKLSGSIKDIMSESMESGNQVTGTHINEFFNQDGGIKNEELKSFLTSINNTRHEENEQSPDEEVTEEEAAQEEAARIQAARIQAVQGQQVLDVNPKGGVKKTRKHHKKGTRSKKPKKRSHKKKH